ncbi:hypothetical protein N0V94_002218, partial [Neodidymelliopsis sp. IMI 364377]
MLRSKHDQRHHSNPLIPSTRNHKARRHQHRNRNGRIQSVPDCNQGIAQQQALVAAAQIIVHPLHGEQDQRLGP